MYDGISACSVLRPYVSEQRATSSAMNGTEQQMARQGMGILRSWKFSLCSSEDSMYLHSASLMKRDSGALLAPKMSQRTHQTPHRPPETYDMPGQPMELLAIMPLKNMANTVPQSVPV